MQFIFERGEHTLYVGGGGDRGLWMQYYPVGGLPIWEVKRTPSGIELWLGRLNVILDFARYALFVPAEISPRATEAP